MLRRAGLLVVLFVVSAALGLAADLNGRWEGSINTPNGVFQRPAYATHSGRVDGAAASGLGFWTVRYSRSPSMRVEQALR